LRKANHDPHQALEEFIEEVRDAGGLMCALAEAVGSPEQLALEYLERVARDLRYEQLVCFADCLREKGFLK